ncbi:MAG: nucleoside-diphosphate sugar epimerase/dehydratase [Methylococcaceae bacterium]
MAYTQDFQFIVDKMRPRTTIFIHDLLMVTLAWMGSFWLRFDMGVIPEPQYSAMYAYIPYVVTVQGVVFWIFGLYRGVWRFSSLPDLIRITKAIITGIFIIAVTLFLFNRLEAVPRSSVPIYICLAMVFLCIPRFAYRFFKDSLIREGVGKRALIVGAGAGGEMLARDLLRENINGYIPVAFVDDDAAKKKRDIRGIRVLGSINQIPGFIEDCNIEVILIAIPSAKDTEMQRIVEICERCKIPFKTLPSVKELLSNQVSQGNLRDVSIEDILGRKPVRLNWKLLTENLQNKSILVTGGGGSIGSELCKQLARFNPGKLIIFDQSEFNLYEVDAELAKTFPDIKHVAVLGDITDLSAVKRVVKTHRPDVIFHAAAYKHVPILEDQVREAVKNNVIGTKIVAEAAIEEGIDRFVLISSDKAVNPTNVMGASKRVSEMLCQNLDRENTTQFMTVRFGNVLDSAGSVVPLFRKQIEKGGPLTITHPEISRYFMTIPEACQLIMQAETVGDGGEVFVLDMGEPVKISYLAEQMIRLSGKRPGEDIGLEYIGLRPGEKLFEELFHEKEELIGTGFQKLLLAKARRFESTSALMAQVDKLERACIEFNITEIHELLRNLVPEFNSSSIQDQQSSSSKEPKLRVVN